MEEALFAALKNEDDLDFFGKEVAHLLRPFGKKKQLEIRRKIMDLIHDYLPDDA